MQLHLRPYYFATVQTIKKKTFILPSNYVSVQNLYFHQVKATEGAINLSLLFPTPQNKD